jgi:hypothetical protein
MGVIRAELGGSWKVFLLSIPLDVMTFLFLVIVSGSVAWQYLGEQWGKSPMLLLVVPGLLFALYYVFFRRIFLEHLLPALVYFVALSAVTILLPVIPVLVAPLVFVTLCAGVYLRYDKTHSPAPERVRAVGELIEIPTAKIYSNINGVYVQQFLANTESTFKVYRALFREGKVRGQSIPEMISAYPRRLLRNQLTERDVEAVIESAIRETGLDAQKVNEYLNGELDDFLKTQRETTVYGYEKVDIRKIVDEMEQSHTECYQYEPLHYEDLKKICEAEGLDVINLKDLEVLAGLITYTNIEGQQKFAILMRDDDSVHKALKEFAMAHELGHWCAHIKGKQREELDEREFYLNSLHDLGQFEDEANEVALITLFPASYLAVCDMNNTLDEERIFEEYIKGMRDSEKRDPEGQLKKNMMGFIRMRINNYKKHRYVWLPQTRLSDKRPLPKEMVRPLANYIDEDFAWAELDDKYTVIDANQKFAELVGLTKEQLLQMKINVIELSAEPRSRDITMKQLETKRADLNPKFYVTKYNNLQTGEITPVTICAFPIVESVKNNKYTGSFGIVTAIHRKAEASH